MPLLRTASDIEPLRERPRRLLAVFAHPDDESYGSAGALARAGNDTDAASVLLCLTRGEASSMGPRRGMDRDEVGALRTQRLEEVAAICGLDALVVPGLPDGRLARLALADVDAPIRSVLDALRPQVVVTHCPRGVNGHADHVAVHWAVRRAIAGREGIRLAMTAYPPAVAEAASPRLLFATPDDEIDVTLELSEPEIEKKERCLRVHEALVTLRAEPSSKLAHRPPLEHFDVLDEAWDPRLGDLFDAL